MNRIFALSKLRNGIGRSCSFDRKKMPSPRTAQMARQTLGKTLAILGGGLDGLIELDAVERLAKDGLNEVAHEKPPPWLVQLLSCFKNPFLIVFVTLAIIQHVTSPGDLRPIIVGVMVVISVGLQFWREYRSALAAEKLEAPAQTTASPVRRPSEDAQPEPREIPPRELVLRDLVRLSAGDLVPAPGRLISSHDLFVSQAALTGEALPVEKHDTAQPQSRSAFVSAFGAARHRARSATGVRSAGEEGFSASVRTTAQPAQSRFQRR